MKKINKEPRAIEISKLRRSLRSIKIGSEILLVDRKKHEILARIKFLEPPKKKEYTVRPVVGWLPLEIATYRRKIY